VAERELEAARERLDVALNKKKEERKEEVEVEMDADRVGMARELEAKEREMRQMHADLQVGTPAGLPGARFTNC
jgi:hypothetical protein